TRIAQRLALNEKTVRARLRELRDRMRPRTSDGSTSEEATPSAAPAAPEERELLTVLLADPALVPVAAAEIQPGQIQHPGLRQLLEGLYALQAEGLLPTLDLLRPRIANPRLATKALEFQELGRANSDRLGWLRKILVVFRRKYQV